MGVPCPLENVAHSCLENWRKHQAHYGDFVYAVNTVYSVHNHRAPPQTWFSLHDILMLIISLHHPEETNTLSTERGLNSSSLVPEPKALPLSHNAFTHGETFLGYFHFVSTLSTGVVKHSVVFPASFPNIMITSLSLITCISWLSCIVHRTASPALLSVPNSGRTCNPTKPAGHKINPFGP